MKLIITPTAAEDLEALTRYLAKRSPSGLANVLSALENSMTMITEGLVRGRETFREDVREIVEPKYGYVIPYFIEGDRAYVLRVYNSRRRPLTPEDINRSLTKRDESE